MSDKPASKTSNVFSFPKPRRREDTALFETGPKTNKTVVVTDPAAEPLTDKMEIPSFTAVDKRTETLGSLEEMTFEKGVIVRDQGQVPGLKFFEILSGFAHERALDMNGSTKADPRDLGVGDIIGLTSFTRIVSKTVLTVRVYDLEKLAAGGNHELHTLAMRKLLGASTNATTENRNAIVKAQQELLEATQATQAVMDQQSGMQKELDELRSLTIARVVALREKTVRPFVEKAKQLDEKLKDRDKQIAFLEAWLQTVFELLPPQLEELHRLRKDREADLASMQLSFEPLKEMIVQGILSEGDLHIAELVAIVSSALETMSESTDPSHARKAVETLNELFTFKMRMPQPPKRDPAT